MWFLWPTIARMTTTVSLMGFCSFAIINYAFKGEISIISTTRENDITISSDHKTSQTELSVHSTDGQRSNNSKTSSTLYNFWQNLRIPSSRYGVAATTTTTTSSSSATVAKATATTHAIERRTNNGYKSIARFSRQKIMSKMDGDNDDDDADFIRSKETEIQEKDKTDVHDHRMDSCDYYDDGHLLRTVVSTRHIVAESTEHHSEDGNLNIQDLISTTPLLVLKEDKVPHLSPNDEQTTDESDWKHPPTCAANGAKSSASSSSSNDDDSSKDSLSDTDTTTETDSESSFEFYDFRSSLEFTAKETRNEKEFVFPPGFLESFNRRHQEEFSVSDFTEDREHQDEPPSLWRTSTFSPIEEEKESDFGSDTMSTCHRSRSETASTVSSSSSSSSDRVFQTFASTPPDHSEEINELTDLKDDPDFQLLVLQEGPEKRTSEKLTKEPENTRLRLMLRLDRNIFEDHVVESFSTELARNIVTRATNKLSDVTRFADALSRDIILVATTQAVAILLQAEISSEGPLQLKQRSTAISHRFPMETLAIVNVLSTPIDGTFCNQSTQTCHDDTYQKEKPAHRKYNCSSTSSRNATKKVKDVRERKSRIRNIQAYVTMASNDEQASGCLVLGHAIRKAMVQRNKDLVVILSNNVSSIISTNGTLNMPSEAFVTVATNDEYAFGGVVLAESLHRTGTNRELVILITNDVSLNVRQLLSDVYDHVYLTTELCSHDDVTLSLMGRPELGVSFTKLHCWRLTQYNKCVFLDADTMVLQNCDELFERDELSAVPDTGWPDCFNSGVFVFQPSLDTYARLIGLATSHGSFDGGDQGILNAYFGNWRNDMSKRLPFVYNVVSNKSYTYAPAYRHYSSGVKIVHFLGSEKPWSVQWMTESGNVQVYHRHPRDMNAPVLQMWMDLFKEKVLPKLPKVAQEKVSRQPTVTVQELLDAIRDAENRKYETTQQWQEADHLLHEYFPSQAHQYIPSHPPPPQQHQEYHYEPPPPPPPPPEIHHYEPPPPEIHHYQPPQQSSYSDHQHSPPQMSHHDPPQSHYEPSPQTQHYDPPPQSSHYEPPPPESHHSYEPQSTHQEHHHQHYSQSDDNSQHWRAPQSSYQPEVGQTNTPNAQEPADPHWEALLWHTVQSPWEPPSPPSLDLYEAPSQHANEQQPEASELTFGWFSTDDGSRTPPSERQDVESSKPSESQLSVLGTYESARSEDHNNEGQNHEHTEEECVSDNDNVSIPKSETQEESLARMKSWEEGNIDFMGKDRFDNIWRRLEFLYHPEEPEIDEDLDEIRDTASELPDSTSSTSLLDGDTPVPSTVGGDEDDDDDQDDIAISCKDSISLSGDGSLLVYPLGDYSGMVEWQEGRIDFEGKDRSDNIMNRLDLIFSGKLVLPS